MNQKLKAYGIKIILLMGLCASALLWQAGPLRAANDAAAGFKQGEELNYAIYAYDELIGYHSYTVERKLELMDKNYWVIDSQSQLKVGIGSIPKIDFQYKTMLEQKNLQPFSFACIQSENQLHLKLEAIFSPTMLVISRNMAEKQNDRFLNLDQPTFMLMNNLWGKHSVMVEEFKTLILLTGDTPEKSFKVFDPVLGDISEIKVTKANAAQEGRLKTYQLFAYGRLCYDITYDRTQGVITEIKAPTEKFRICLGDHKLKSQVAASKGLDLWLKQVLASNIFFTEAEKLEGLRLKLKLQGKAEYLNHDILGYTQTFTGESTPEASQGEIVIKTGLPDLTTGGAFPVTATPELQPYLRTEAGIEAHDENLVSQAQEITYKEKDSLKAALLLAQWIAKHVKNAPALPSALQVLENLEGSSESQAYLLAAFCRSLGIPARVISGIIYSAGNFIPHYWTEVYLPQENNWVAFDTTSQEFLKLSAAHIALGEGTCIIQELAVTDFLPHPKRVAYFNQEIQWPLGESRTYRIIKEGQLQGTETAVLSEMAIVKGEEAYLADITVQPALGQSKLFKLAYTLNGLPLTCETFTDQKPLSKLNFEADKIVETATEATREYLIPYAYGTYLWDSRSFAQLALIVEQLPIKKAGDKFSVHIYNPASRANAEVHFEVGGAETLELPEGAVQVWPCKLDDNLTVYRTLEGKVVKISVADSKLEVVLQQSALKL